MAEETDILLSCGEERHVSGRMANVMMERGQQVNQTRMGLINVAHFDKKKVVVEVAIRNLHTEAGSG